MRMEQELLLRADEAIPSAGTRRWLLTTSGMAAAVLAVLAVISHVRFGSISAGLDYLAGKRLIVDDATHSVGTVSGNGVRTVPVRLTNATRSPVRILGSGSTCTCLTLAERLPLEIERSTMRQLRIEVRAPAARGDFAAVLRLYTDYPNRPEVAIQVNGRSE